jgi:hypothetical protein
MEVCLRLSQKQTKKMMFLPGEATKTRGNIERGLEPENQVVVGQVFLVL